MIKKMSEKVTNSNNAQFTLVIPFSMELWHFLVGGQKNFQKKDGRFTRAEAFDDLLERQHAAAMRDVNEHIKADITVLSQAWQWQRTTTATFLDTLEGFGVLTSQKSGNSRIFRLNYTQERKSDSGAT
jgi:hypothetical protein